MTNLVSFYKGQYAGEISDIHYLQGLTIGLTLYPKPSGSNPLHYHQNPHLSLLLEGGHVEKRASSSFQRVPGDILFCHGQEPHQFITHKFPSKNLNIEIDYSFLDQYGISQHHISKAITNQIDTRFTLLKIYKELLYNDSYKESSIQMLLLDLVSNGTKGTKKPSWACLLEQLLQDRWNEVLTLKELSTLTGVHPVTISKYFSTYFSCTLGEYMRKLKITKSIPLIRNPHLSLTDIAFTCGFADQSHFIRTFKELTGWLPGKFQGL